ncbi:MAG: ATP-binding protein [Bacteroidales bacterium]|nr:ATP-binding protein [Bacteroidales bacterium]
MKISKVNNFKKVFGFGSVLASADELKLKSINIAFSKEHAHLEKEFLREYAVKSQGAFRFAMILALIFYDLFAILDKSTVPDIYQQIWIIRFGIVTPVLIIAFFFSFNKLFLKFGQITIALVWFITGGGIIYMNIIMSGVGIYSYYAGLMLIFFFGYTFVRARFLNSVLIGWVLFLGYMLTSYFYTDLSANHLKITGAFFLSANLIGMFINYTLEVNARRDFFMRKLVAIEQEKVVAANESLEKRVVDRTTQLTKTNRELNKEIKRRLQYEEERNKLESQLFQMQKMETIGTLAGGIAHDFNNILTPILGYTEMALEELDEENSLRYDVEQINNAALRAKDLVQQILTFSRQVDVEKKPIYLDKVIREVLGLIKASFPANIEIILDLDANCGTVMADGTQIHQVIMNLCTNASHAMMETGGTLKVNLSTVKADRETVRKTPKLKLGTYVCVSVTDSGHGMDKQTLGRIFEPFFTKKEVGSGSGLGLSVVHGIVNSFDGAITVESEPNKGATFKVFLPQHGEGQDSSQKVGEQNTKGREHIIFIDDEEEITFMGKRMLEGLGYTVNIHTKSIEALKDFTTDPDRYDLIVTDQTMPYMLGTDLIEKFKEIRPDIRAIIITGFGDSITEEVAKDKGIDAIVIKPLILSKFGTLIRKILDKKVTKKTQ